METVDIIASGYEWICPDCDGFNSEIEITEHVTCSHCKTKFKVDSFYHATKF